MTDALTSVEPGVRYVISSAPTGTTGARHRHFSVGDVLTYTGITGRPDSYGGVRMRHADPDEADDRCRHDAGYYTSLTRLVQEDQGEETPQMTATTNSEATHPGYVPWTGLGTGYYPAGKYRLTGSGTRTLDEGALVTLRESERDSRRTPDSDGDLYAFSEHDDHSIGHIPARYLVPFVPNLEPVEGARVRILRANANGAVVHEGDEGVIVSVGGGEYEVLMDVYRSDVPRPTRGFDWYFNLDDFEVIAPPSAAPAGEPAPKEPVVGGKIRFTQEYVQGASVLVGDEVEIIEVFERGGGTRIRTKTTAGSGDWVFILSRGGFDLLPAPTAEHQADIARLGKWLQTQAEQRNWCGEYDRLVGAINEELNVKLPERERGIVVDLGPLGHHVITARTEAEARQKVRDAVRALQP